MSGTGTSDQINWQMTGIPPFQISLTGPFPISAVQTGSYLLLNYLGPLPEGFTVYFPVFNDSLRTKFGAYLVGKSFYIPPPAPPPSDSVASLNTVVGNDVFVDLSEPFGINLINGLPQWEHLPAAEMPTAASLAGTVLQLTYTTAPVSTDTIVIPTDDPHIRTVDGGYVTAGTLTVP